MGCGDTLAVRPLYFVLAQTAIAPDAGLESEVGEPDRHYIRFPRKDPHVRHDCSPIRGEKAVS